MDNYLPSPAYEELGPTRRSTFTEQRSPPKPPSAKTARLIAELGLRYRPSQAADLEAHAAALALLTRDVAHINCNALEGAIPKWVQNNKFMPKASELIELARPNGSGQVDLHAMAARANTNCIRPDLHWVVRNGDLKLEPL